MATKTIDANMLAKMFLAGAQNIEAKKEFINELNVFPVPDGDTGTNMTLTILSAAKEVTALADVDMKNLAKAISSGSLRGARGNSGVILSQLLRGFTKSIRDEKEIDTAALAAACQRARDTAYKAVMKPKEGTILTVASGIADKAAELALETEDLEEFIPAVIEHADEVLQKTPEMLPVLKQAGVVDSGGQGLMQIVKGCLEGLKGKEAVLGQGAEGTSPAVKVSSSPAADIETADIKFGYCTEFIINLASEFKDSDEKGLKQYLESIGDSLVVVADDEIVKVHVHTNDPGLALQRALTFGSLSRIKIDNMREEHEERLIKDAERVAREQKEEELKAQEAQEVSERPRKETGFVAVCAGTGLADIFKGIGADVVIEGGQTMNPSTEDILKAVEQVNADTVYVLPNNKNIILAAEQAKKLSEDCQVVVVPSKTVPQGITALINFAPDLAPQENLEIMEQEMGRVKTGQITYAVRNTSVDGREIHEGDIMGIGDSGMLAVGSSVSQTAMDALNAMVDDDSELITIYYGKSVKEEDAENFLEEAREQFSGCEIELHFGGQPVYYYLISVE